MFLQVAPQSRIYQLHPAIEEAMQLALDAQRTFLANISRKAPHSQTVMLMSPMFPAQNTIVKWI
jgi:hypothetical protein